MMALVIVLPRYACYACYAQALGATYGVSQDQYIRFVTAGFEYSPGF